MEWERSILAANCCIYAAWSEVALSLCGQSFSYERGLYQPKFYPFTSVSVHVDFLLRYTLPLPGNYSSVELQSCFFFHPFTLSRQYLVGISIHVKLDTVRIRHYNLSSRTRTWYPNSSVTFLSPNPRCMKMEFNRFLPTRYRFACEKTKCGFRWGDTTSVIETNFISFNEQHRTIHFCVVEWRWRRIHGGSGLVGFAISTSFTRETATARKPLAVNLTNNGFIFVTKPWVTRVADLQ